MDQPWTPRPKPEQADRLERRIEFGDYEATRLFLEQLNALSEEQQRFPDISFGRTYVNLTVRPESDGAAIDGQDQAFAAAIDALLNQ
ncbi:4a-hydroxytetrahydrobiopterin dehydratase [Cyanobium sp. HWJ4-Hawea]|uniref:4a-hydroxytetrahydrobiopterin dehydratase n=1 Tax=unclassified Cyanobium TaxID=2627006 RepID=UPI0020CF1E27|nr:MULTISPECIES: 4a-hydroxytetrahydrobiopterin dehydratase [unclassified Cyanobium]MCP9774808.1 4a-hydroxytetrahydrobiopterin dehydratase [Cyanobium sp. WAJ14-Wanaka]MCP9809360.1 4a-hydroxytetrahydrobiopterin dehydratase [Cyanobium sp. HWJ4-Hawea]